MFRIKRSRTILSLLAMALLLSACASTAPAGTIAPAPATPTASTPRDTLVIAQASDVVTMDPQATDQSNTQRVLNLIFDNLTQYGEGSNELDPNLGLATAWQASSDAKVWRLELRRGVTFSDGTPFDASVVQFNLDRQTKPDHPYYSTGTYPMVDINLNGYVKTRIIDPYTCELVFSEPAPLQDLYLAEASAMMISPKAFEKWGKDVSLHPIGTGPYILESWDPGVAVTLVRNPHYWGKQPRIERVVIRPIPEAQTRMVELSAGSIDLTLQAPPDLVPELEKDARFSVLKEPDRRFWFIYLNCKEGPFADVRVRQALNYAMDRQKLCQYTFNGLAVPVDTAFPASMKAFYTDDVLHYAYDPIKAKELLAEAGYPNGVDVVWWVPTTASGSLDPVAMATALQADLATVGIRAQIKTFEWGAFLDMLPAGLGTNGNPPGDMASITIGLGNDDPWAHLYWAISGEQFPPDGWNVGYYDNARITVLLNQVKSVADREQRRALYAEIQKLFSQEVPFASIASQIKVWVVKSNLKGLRIHTNERLLLQNAYWE